MFNNTKEYTFQDQQQQQHQIGARCAGCHHVIEDKYVFNLMNTYWHEECLQCSQCRVSLKKTCFFKNGLIYCKDDYFKQFGTRCNACYELILSNELIMRFLVNNPPQPLQQQQSQPEKQLLNYHLNCFKCTACERLLQKGDEFVLKSEGIFCKHDYEQSFQASHSTLLNRLNSSKQSYSTSATTIATSNATSVPHQFNPDELVMSEPNSKAKQTTPRKSSSSRRITKRPRTILNAVQRYDFREAFKQSPKPCRKVREHLASKTGLSVRVVQVWFQNERAKMKKMQRRQQQNLLNQKLNKKGGKSSKKSAGAKKSNKRKTIDSDSIISEENSLAGEDDEFGGAEDDEDEESDDESDEEFDESDDEMDEEEDDEDEEITRLNRLTCNLASNNNTSSSSSSSSSTSSLSEFTNTFMPQQQQTVYTPLGQQHQQQLYFQQHNQLVNNPIDRLYSMQNAYFV